MNVVESDQVASTRWLTSPNIALGKVQPFFLLRTEFAGRTVHRVLLSIEYGLPV
ncbi:MbcA/ParS/Xre antitoxin family protein [Pseudomonas sp. BIOMIG1BAC]|uniref:MbcA/ParS/Xre antitoxin family protein n=1 Tax=Pseudomonas sp. BIOMIG1BAC TaxID=1758730 RepID=UPI001D15BA88